MGSSITTVGNNGGTPLVTFTAGGSTDSGPLLCNVQGSVILGYKNSLFQLTGTGTNWAITAYGTIDIPTATGIAGANQEWVELPAPSTEASYQWSNPMSAQDGKKTLFCSAPFISYRFTAAPLPGQTVTGSITVQMMSVP